MHQIAKKTIHKRQKHEAVEKGRERAYLLYQSTSISIFFFFQTSYAMFYFSSTSYEQKKRPKEQTHRNATTILDVDAIVIYFSSKKYKRET